MNRSNLTKLPEQLNKCQGSRGLRQPVGAVKAPTGPLIPGSGATKLPAYPLVRIVSLASNASDGWMTLFHPFSSDKIRAKILDLGYGGARRALYNLSPKSARILSAAITIDRWTVELSNNLALPLRRG